MFNFRESERESGGTLVVFMESIVHDSEREKTTGSQYTDLTHTSSEGLAEMASWREREREREGEKWNAV